MFDGAELGKATAAHPHDIEAALTPYEEALFPRSESGAGDGHLILELCLGDRAPFGLVDFFTGSPRRNTKEPRVLIHTADGPGAIAVGERDVREPASARS